MYTYVNPTYKRDNIKMTTISFLINYRKRRRLNYDGSYKPLLIKKKTSDISLYNWNFLYLLALNRKKITSKRKYWRQPV